MRKNPNWVLFVLGLGFLVGATHTEHDVAKIIIEIISAFILITWHEQLIESLDSKYNKPNKYD